ncbi:MAG: tRNA (adenosine(37)-N6)-dimethylallyltransferase MiaA [Acidimicrobiia bacterium]
MLGPTASGKSEVALALAQDLGAEIVSVDSMQVYRGMDIGTAKPSEDDRASTPHHLIDVVNPDEDFSVADSQRLGRTAIESASGSVIIAGGTGLAFRAIVDPLQFPGQHPEARADLEALELGTLQVRLLEVDPTAGEHIDMANPRRLVRALEVHALTGQTPSERAATSEAAAVRAYESRFQFAAVGFDPGAGLQARAVARFDAMLADGLLDEVAGLASRLGRTAAQAVGYKELLPVVAGETTLDDGRDAAITATLAVAANQRTYFRRDPRIRWLEWDDDAGVRIEAARRELKI